LIPVQVPESLEIGSQEHMHKGKFEELTTILAQMETCLNASPKGYRIDELTPGHF